VGWQLSRSLRTDLALDALEMGIWTRTHAGQAVDGVIHHSDRGGQSRFNYRRLHGEIGLIPPAEYEDNHYRHKPAPAPVGASVRSLH
jgi:putative transposase